MEMHLVLLEIARKDLEAASCLLEKKLYPHSVFFLHQSIEKLVKSLGRWTKIINITEAKYEIGHIPHKIYVKFLENLSKLMMPDTAISIMEKMGSGREYVEKLRVRADNVRTLLSKYSPREALNSSLSSNDPLSDLLAEIQRETREMIRDKLELQEQSEKISEKEVEKLREQLPQSLEGILPRETTEALKMTFKQIPPDMTIA